MAVPFTHLHVHSQYSLLDGASKPEELLRRAMELDMDTIAITDHGNMYGAIDFYQTAERLTKEATKDGRPGIRVILGCEVYLAPGSRFDRVDKQPRYHLILLAENNEGYRNLSRLVSLGYLDGFYRKPRIDKEILRKYSKGLICLTACVQGEIPQAILSGGEEKARAVVQEYLEIFDRDHLFLELQNHDLPQEARVRRGLHKLAEEFGLRLVATNDLHYVRREDAGAQDVLLCIQTNKTVTDPDRMKFNNDWYYCKSYEEMQALFPDDEEALRNTHAIAERCHVDFTFGKLLLPEFPIPEAYHGDADAYVRALCLDAIPRRYGPALDAAGSPSERQALDRKVRERLDYELGIIQTMGYAAYFLIVWDFIHYCRSHHDAAGNPDPIPVGPGRGSAAGSIVAYLLQITNIDPLDFDLLFERFLNPERVSMPDIDTDFCYKRRGEVLDYVIRKYGPDHVSLIVTFGTLQARAAVRDAGRALGIPLAKVDRVAKAVPRTLGITLKEALTTSKELRTLCDTDEEVRHLLDIAKSVEGLPRNTGTHAAGVVIAPKPLIDLVPLQLDEGVQGEGISQARMITTQYDKTQVEELGLLKMDFLGLRTLTVLDDAVRFIRETTGEDVDLDHLPLEDKAVSDMLCAGDTQGVFQLESGGMTRLVMRLAPKTMKDLVPLVALYRPGPLDAGMADKFIEGRRQHHAVASLHPLLDPILADTYGVVLYQEQVMQTASILAGFSLGEADILRRAMGKKKVKDLIAMKTRFVEGARKLHQVPPEKSEEIFEILLKFAGYGFNKSHSVAYGLVAYQTAYLKAHWPAPFFAALLTSVIGDPVKMSWYIQVCRDRGIRVLPPDINASRSGFSVEDGAVRFGLTGIKSVGEGAVEEIVRVRQEGGPFRDILDFCSRVPYRQLNTRLVENLIKCGAMDSLGAHRSQLLAVYKQALDLGQQSQRDTLSGQFSLFGDAAFTEVNTLTLPVLAEMPRSLLLKEEKELLGFYVTGHPLDGYREALKGFTPLYQMGEENGPVQDGEFVRVAGLVADCNIRLTKKGDNMAILTLEDFTGRLSVLVFPRAYNLYSRLLMQDAVLAVEGRFSVDEREAKVLASEIVELREGEPAPPLGRAARGGFGRGRAGAAGAAGQEESGVTFADRPADGPSGYEVREDMAFLPVPEGAVLELTVPADKEACVTTELIPLLQAHPGTHMVFLKLLGSRRRLRLHPNFYTDGSDAFQDAVRKLLGDGAFRVKPV
ncbi:MAG: DNA polymerase III subunit alpha [Succiniclasticum sp.]|nr:DNA polymerase III subunit alpha [Succiniclasticum sp.]MDY6303164.1 DNA polymerase III subunit alpha [Succiniclasticum sp.]